jgi:hypothetical protein
MVRAARQLASDAFFHGTSRRAAPVGFLNRAPDLTHTNTKGLANALSARIGLD